MRLVGIFLDIPGHVEVRSNPLAISFFLIMLHYE